MAKLSRQVDTGWRGGLGAFQVLVDADASGALGIATVMPENGEIVDAIVESHATVVGATATVRTGDLSITDAIACTPEHGRVSAGEIEEAVSTRSRGDNINVQTAAAGNRGLVTIYYVPR